jgi:hypothetical protein
VSSAGLQACRPYDRPKGLHCFRLRAKLHDLARPWPFAILTILG